ncbi:septum formation protein [Methylovorus glucosotrophus]|uniref:Maf family nucleotide pyrophosphatase n=1 Tax=Methylovorus glucosotrophus TaxID=266009 RepID=UPI0013312B1C|nr:Maf family nucleotide pyrophosphatase [Methylovorus glucosotrophus]KAF0843952.1 septum formation protein [Methylovorus glucosotrophus]
MSVELILASSSPFRRDLLTRLDIPFICCSPDIDESPLANEKPEDTALRLSQEKARKVAAQYPHALIIGCDQVATLDGQQIGKPGTHAKAVRQLQSMRGREVTFHSALCLYNAATGTIQADVVPYVVEFRMLSDAQIENYLHKEQPYNCAGSAKSEGLGIALIARMEGTDPNALIGLPLIRLITMLQNEGLTII